MGNSASSSGRGHHDDTVDFGFLTPQGVYTGQRDWNQNIVGQLIVDRRLAPFYRPLEDYDESWDDETILAHRKEPPAEDGSPLEPAHSRPDSVHSRSHTKRGSASGKEVSRHPEAALYRGAVECPICFLYYPPNINYSRCCEQAICTECFVQIKRAEPTATHLDSEPAACPYCVRDNFGVVYTAPSWRAGFGSDGTLPPSPNSSQLSQVASNKPTIQRRRKSFGANDPEVVTTDTIRPDWEAKVAAVRAAVQRRANRRIIMRQVGDRLVPVGITSGRVHVLPTEEGAQAQGQDNGEGGSRRSRRRDRDLNRLLGLVGGGGQNYPGVMGGQDLEDLMMAEAMRLSLLDEEERQRKENEEKKKEAAKKAAEGADASASGGEGSTPASTSSPEIALPAVNGPSLLPPPASSSTSLLTPTSAIERGRSPTGHRPTSSVTSLRSATASTPTGGANSASARASSQPPYSTLGAALKSATATGGAVGSPAPSGSATPVPTARSVSPVPPVPVIAAAAADTTTPPPPPPKPASNLSRSMVAPGSASGGSSPLLESPSLAASSSGSVSGTGAETPILAPTPERAPTLPPKPPMTMPMPVLAHHQASFASSVFSNASAESEGDAYGLLSSSPESEGDEPLLSAPVPLARGESYVTDAGLE